MSLASHACNRLRKLYGCVFNRMHLLNRRRFLHDGALLVLRRSSDLERLEPRLMLDGDTIGTATALALAEDPADSGYWVGRTSQQIDPAGDVDYWSFEALAGDLVSLSVDTPDSGLDPYLQLRNDADGVIWSDDNSGPDYDAFLGPYEIPTSGTYNARAQGQSSTGAYELRVDLVRGIEIESDLEYANDSISGADRLARTPSGQTTTTTTTAMRPIPTSRARCRPPAATSPKSRPTPGPARPASSCWTSPSRTTSRHR